MKKIICLLLFLSMQAFSYDRVIVLGASIAKTMIDLELAEKIIARDKTGMVLSEIKDIKDLGMPNTISAEAVLALKPDLLLYGSKSKNEKLLNQLKILKIETVEIKEKDELSNITSKIKQISKVMDVSKKKTKDLVLKVENELKELKGFSKHEKKVAFIYARGAHHMYMAGKKTPAQTMLRELKIENAFAAFDGFKPVSVESVLKANPDYLIMLKSGVRSLKNVWDIPGMKMTNAGKAKRLIQVDTLAFLGFTSDTPKLLMELNKKFNE